MNPTGAPPPMPPSPLPPSGGSTAKKVVLILLALFGVMALVVCGVGGYVFYRVKNSELGKGVAASIEAMANSESAPGAQELRAQGCTKAQVMDMRAFIKLAADAADAGAELEAGDIPGIQVNCILGQGTELSCDQVAKTYIAAAKPDVTFSVQVLREVAPPEGKAAPSTEVGEEGETLESVCGSAYSKTGERRELPEEEGEPMDDFDPVDPKVPEETGGK